MLVRHFVVVHGHRELVDIIRTHHPPSRLAAGLDRRQQHSDQDADDRDDDQQLDKRKTA
jgi:hypothetical protein